MGDVKWSRAPFLFQIGSSVDRWKLTEKAHMIACRLGPRKLQLGVEKTWYLLYHSTLCNLSHPLCGTSWEANEPNIPWISGSGRPWVGVEKVCLTCMFGVKSDWGSLGTCYLVLASRETKVFQHTQFENIYIVRLVNNTKKGKVTILCVCFL